MSEQLIFSLFVLNTNLNNSAHAFWHTRLWLPAQQVNQVKQGKIRMSTTNSDKENEDDLGLYKPSRKL